ncbi:Fanconi anemia group J protein [Kappamyces sp. JEL0680]|nr:Fanconi anemia group J protein [Kappamyces sp. JEL0680]
MIKDLNDYSSESASKDNRIKQSSKEVLSKLLMVLDFIFTKSHQHGIASRLTAEYRMVLSRQQGKSRGPIAVAGHELRIEYWCLNSAVIFKDIGAQCKSVILTSGTLSPLASYKMELGIPFQYEVEANHVIGSDQIWGGVIPCGPSGAPITSTFDNLGKEPFQDELGLTIYRLACKIPSGILVFLPSYSWLAKLIDRWKETKIWSYLEKVKTLFAEPKGVKSAMEAEKVVAKYDVACKTSLGAMMFCVYRGKMSEGIDFANERARAVVSPKLMEIKSYHSRFHQSLNIMDGETWYKIQAFRALNQALGRCIRHQNDWGGVILLDARFNATANSELLPKWFRGFFQSCKSLREAEGSLERFYAAASARKDPAPCASGHNPAQPDRRIVPSRSDDAIPPPGLLLQGILTTSESERAVPETIEYDGSVEWHCQACDTLLLQTQGMPLLCTPSWDICKTIDGEFCDAGLFEQYEQCSHLKPCGHDEDSGQEWTFGQIHCASCDSLVAVHVFPEAETYSNRLLMINAACRLELAPSQ